MSVRLDVTAKSDSVTDEALARRSDDDFGAEKRYMLRQMLAERFKLQIHPETRMSKTYELVTAKRTGGLMTLVQGEAGKTISTCNPHFSSKGIKIDSKGCLFTILLSTLRQTLGTNVADDTGLSGMYAHHLTWSSPSVRTQDEEECYLQILDAVREQLGLEIKGPITSWVVDHIERPAEN